MSLKEYVVTLHSREDLESFYDDMETPGGNLYIPDRQVEVAQKRPISRNTHYMLTAEEAELVRQDERVWDVELKEILDAVTIKPQGYSIDNGQFDKDPFSNADDINWGLLRHSERQNRTDWGYGDTVRVTDNLNITASGKNVDVVIVDGHIDPSHPEMAANSDGTGGSRVQQFNWFSLNPDIGQGAAGTYVYPPYIDGTNPERTGDNNHGIHVAGTAAGNTYGWARDANIYNISPYATNPNSVSNLWDYIRAWHNTKPINADTGRRNPTITNHSYGSNINAGGAGSNFGNVTAINYRGTTFNPGRDLTQAELQARGCYAPNADGEIEFSFYSTSIRADVQDAISDGIIVVHSAGNSSWKMVKTGDQDYNNAASIPFSGSSFNFALHRGGSLSSIDGVIVVGALSYFKDDRKSDFSNCGNAVDVYAAGEGINSSLLTGGATDPRNASYRVGKYKGTSMASPQAAGLLSCLAETWPGMTNSQASDWLVYNATQELMFDSEADDAMDRTSLQGSPNLMMFWKNVRPVDGGVFPRNNIASRANLKQVYPRPKIRRKG